MQWFCRRIAGSSARYRRHICSRCNSSCSSVRAPCRLALPLGLAFQPPFPAQSVNKPRRIRETVVRLPHAPRHLSRFKRCFNASAATLIDFNQSPDETLQLFRIICRDSIKAAGFDFHSEGQLIGGLEGRVLGAHFVKKAAERPHVALFVVAAGSVTVRKRGKVDSRTVSR